MNFFGYVPLRRGIIEHLREGKLTNNEFLALVVLIMLADRKTGAGTINAPALRFYIPELSKDAAKRVLLSLEEKGYIYRKITPFSQVVYPFWVNHYCPTDGPYKGLQINLAKVFESKNLKDIEYVNLAPDDAPGGAPEGAPDPAHNYKRREEKHRKENKTSISNKDEIASICATQDQTKPPRLIAEAKPTMQGASALPCALPSKSSDTPASASAIPARASVSRTNTAMLDMATVFRMGIDDPHLAFEAGLRWGSEGLFEDLRWGHQLSSDDAYKRLFRQILSRDADA